MTDLLLDRPLPLQGDLCPACRRVVGGGASFLLNHKFCRVIAQSEETSGIWGDVGSTPTHAALTEEGNGMCPGVMSAINPGRPIRLCLSCRLYSYGLPGVGPATHDGVRWVCKQMPLDKA